MSRNFFLGLLIVCLLGAGAAYVLLVPDYAQVVTTDTPRPVFERRAVIIERAKKTPLSLNVEVALTKEQLSYGLMFKSELPNGQGMLFLLPKEEKAFFWMKNTVIPLDMLFIASDGRIVKIARNMKPEDASAIPSEEPVIAVLEIGGGQAASLSIQEGDKVLLPSAAHHIVTGSKP